MGPPCAMVAVMLPSSTHSDEPRGPGSGWGLLATAVAASAALLLSSWSSYARIQEASLTLARGQGEALLTQARARFGPIGRPPTSEEVAAFLDDEEDSGITFLAFLNPDGTPIVSGGTASGPVERPPSEPTVIITDQGDVVRMLQSAPVPMRPGRRKPPPPGPHLIPAVVIEFEPKVAEGLESGALQNLGASAFGALVIIGAAGVLAGQIRRREQSRERMNREKRLAALGEMSAVLAHELRNPLTSLKGHAQLLVEQLEAGSRQQKKAERIVASAKRLEDLTSTLLEFVRSGKLTREPMSPSSLVERVVAELGADRFTLDLANLPASFSLDAPRMEQVLTNLCRNALDASSADDPVEIHGSMVEKNLVLTVRDHGEGIAPGQEEAIFEAFHTTRTRGTGLGLAVARLIVEKHGGTLHASNHPEGGALFQITLPERAPG